MQLMTLDSNLQPNRMVESYQSCIWTERYNKNGDFTLTSHEVAATSLALPKESFIALRESSVPMVIEDHKISKKPREAPLLTVTGRSFETVLERRASVKRADGPEVWTLSAAKEADAAYRVMRTVLGDFARIEDGVEILPFLAPAVSPMDVIPEVSLTVPADYLAATTVAWVPGGSYSAGEIVADANGDFWRARLANTNSPPIPGSTWEKLSYEIPRKDLYSAAMELIATNRRGLKAVRPSPDSSKVGIEIYNGANLTGEGENSDPNHVLVFDARFDQFTDTTYLLSNRGSTNVGYVFGAAGGRETVLKTTAPEPSGLDRRVLLVDDAGVDEAARRSKGLVELYKYNATALFDGQIAEQVAALYNKQDGYSLGDILKLTGEYGLSQNVRVVEFIRSSDASGEKAYPAFEAVS